MVVKSATKKKLMDLGIPEEVAHVLSEDRKWFRGGQPQGPNPSIKELINDSKYEEFVNIIRPVMNHYPFKTAPVENLMLWYGIIAERFEPDLNVTDAQRAEHPKRAVFFCNTTNNFRYWDGKNRLLLQNKALTTRLKMYVFGPLGPDGDKTMGVPAGWKAFDEKRVRFNKVYHTYNRIHNSINYKVVRFYLF